MAFTRINIAVKPPQEVAEQVVALSKDIGTHKESFFVLDGLHYFPHLTLYSPEYPEKNVDEILLATENIVAGTEPFTATSTLFNSHLGYIDLAMEKTDLWEKLHEAVVTRLNPYRENHIRDKYLSELARYSSIQQKYIQAYGYSEVFTTFRPHITITRLKDEARAKELAQNLTTPFQSFQVTELAAYTMGDHGSCTGIIKEFPLQK